MESWDDFEEHEDEDDDGDDEGADGVGECAFDFTTHGVGFFNLDAQTRQDRIEDAADFAGGDERGIEGREDARMFSECVAECHTRFDVGFDGELNAFEVRIDFLAREEVEGLNDGQTCVDHGRELTRKDDEFAA